MTPEQAREELETFLNEQSEDPTTGERYRIELPVVDAIVCTETDGCTLSQVTFRHLLKIAYNLKDADGL